MSFPEFGTIVEETPRFKEFGEIVKEPSRTQSLGGAAGKGLLKGVSDLVKSTPLPSTSAIPQQLQERIIEQVLPTQQRPLERGIERAARLAPLVLGGPESVLAKGIRTGGAALAGQTLEELGAPEWAQTIAELAAFMSPKLSGKLQPKPSQKEAVEFLRSKGLSDKAITPLLQEEKKLRRLGKYAHKGERVQQRLSEAQEKLGQGYSLLKESAKNLELPRQKVTSFSSNLENKLDNLTPNFRKMVREDVEQLLSKPVTGKSLIDFWQDINNKMSKGAREGIKGGREVLGVLKEPIKQAFQEIDPKAAKEFDLLNQFYSKKQKTFSILRPKQLDDVVDLAEKIGIFGSIATGDLNKLQKILGLVAGRAIATELLINPRLQNLSDQMLKALSKNQIPIFNKLSKKFVDEIQKKNKDLAQKIMSETTSEKE